MVVEQKVVVVDVAAWLGDDVLAVDRVLCGNEHLVVTDPTPLQPPNWR